MVTTDPARRRLRLAPFELDATRMLVHEDPESLFDGKRAFVRALAEAGLMPNGRLVPWANELLSIIARPGLAMTVEIVTEPVTVYHVWATPSTVVLGTPVDAAIELSATEPVALPYLLSHILGLRPHSKARAPAVRIGLSEFAAMRKRLAAGDLVSGELGELLATQRVTWRVTAAWTDTDGPRPAQSVQVMDTDSRGLWTVDTDGELLTLAPSSAREVWHRIAALLPKAGCQIFCA